MSLSVGKRTKSTGDQIMFSPTVQDSTSLKQLLHMKCDLDLFSTGFVKRTKRYPWDGITAYSILTYLFLLFNFY